MSEQTLIGHFSYGTARRVRHCPFCGSDEPQIAVELDDRRYYGRVSCECGGAGPMTGRYPDAAEAAVWAIKFWNNDQTNDSSYIGLYSLYRCDDE
jgi:hypothetical protein